MNEEMSESILMTGWSLLIAENMEQFKEYFLKELEVLENEGYVSKFGELIELSHAMLKLKKWI